MRRSFVAISLAMLVSLALVAASCGGDEDSQGPAAGFTATTVPGSGTSTPPTTEEAGGTDSAKLLEQVRARASQQAGETFYLRYAIRATFEGQKVTGTFELAQKPPKTYFSMAFDNLPAAGDLGGIFEGVSAIDDGTNTYLCFKADDQGMCLKGDAASGSVDISEFKALADPAQLVGESSDTRIERVDGRRIAGVASECWRVASPDFDGTFCLGSDVPILTYVGGTFQGQQATVELESYSKDVPDAVFKPPYPVQDFGGFFMTPTPGGGY